jgi:hypothetical protein
MRPYKSLLACALFAALLVFLTATIRAHHTTVHAQQTISDKGDGQHDFDYAVGTWKFHLKRLKKRLVGSTEWVELDGTTDCRKIMDGRGEVEEMNVESADKSLHIQGLAVRLYNPQSHQWSIYWANAGDGVMEQNPMVGQFTNGRGEFYNQQIFEGRSGLRPLHLDWRHNQHAPLRTSILRRRRKNLGNQLDHRPNKRKIMCGRSSCAPIPPNSSIP